MYITAVLFFLRLSVLTAWTLNKGDCAPDKKTKKKEEEKLY